MSGWPGSVTYHAAMAPVSIILSCMGGLWLCLWRMKWRFIGLVPFVAREAAFDRLLARLFAA